MDNKEYNQYKMNLIFENWRKYLIKEQVGLPGETAGTAEPFNTPEQQKKAGEDYNRREEAKKKAEQEKKQAEYNKVLEDQFKVNLNEFNRLYSLFNTWRMKDDNSYKPVVAGELLKTNPEIVRAARVLSSSVNDEYKIGRGLDMNVFYKAQEVAGLNASSRDAIIGANPFVGRWTEYGRDLEKVIWDKIGIHIPVLDPTLDRAELHPMWENSKFKIVGVLLQFGADIFLDLENLCMLILTLIASIAGGPAGAAAAGSVVGAGRGIALAKRLKRLHDLLTFQGKTTKFVKKTSPEGVKTIAREMGLLDEIYLAAERAGKNFAEKIKNLFSSGTPVPAPMRLSLRKGNFAEQTTIGKIYKFLQGNELLVTAVRGIMSEFFESLEKEFQKIKM